MFIVKSQINTNFTPAFLCFLTLKNMYTSIFEIIYISHNTNEILIFLMHLKTIFVFRYEHGGPPNIEVEDNHRNSPSLLTGI